MVVFEDAIAKKSEYRRFAIRGKDGKGAVDDLSALYETLTRRFKHGNIAGDSGESIDAEQRVASAAGKMTTAVAAETIAANGNDNGEGGSDISGKGHAVPVGVQNDARESPPTSSSRTQTGITLPTSRTWWWSMAASRRSWPPPRRLRTVT